jgi:hypothetical protein
VDLHEHGSVLEVDALATVDVQAGALAAGGVVDVADDLDVGLGQLERAGQLTERGLEVGGVRGLLECVEVVLTEPVAQVGLDVGGRAGGVEDQVAQAARCDCREGQSGAVGMPGPPASYSWGASSLANQPAKKAGIEA